MNRYIGFFIVDATLLQGSFCLAQPYDVEDYTTGTYKHCPAEGKGGDRLLNIAKNRDVAASHYDDVSLVELMHLPEDFPGKRRENWDVATMDRLSEIERQYVRVEGYLVKIKNQGAEACNCGVSTQKDFHLWLGDSSGSAAKESFVVEISPRMFDDHPNWTSKEIKKLIKKKAKVRISGWLLLDQIHRAEVGKSRISRWEVHPIHRIEEWRNGAWHRF